MSSTGQIEAVRLRTIIDIRRLIAALHSSEPTPWELPGWRVFRGDAEAQTGGKGHASRYAARAAGLCGCGAPLAPGRSQCEGCRRADHYRQRRRVELDIANGTCIIGGCKRAAAPGRRSCERHLQAARDRERRRRELAKSAEIAQTMAADLNRAGRYARSSGLFAGGGEILR